MEQTIFFRKRFLALFILTLISWTVIIAQNAGPDQDVACNSATLGALDPSGVWTTSGSATITDPTNPNTTVTGLVTGANTFTWTTGAGSDNVVITYLLANAGSDLPNECSSAVLAASNPAPLTGYWTAVPSGIVFDDSTNPTATVSNLPAGSTNLTWTITSGPGCSNSDVMAVTNNTPVANAGADDETCNNNSYQLNANDPSAQGATGQWSIVSGVGSFADATLFNTVVSSMNQDNNEYQWTVTKNGCTASDNVIITNNTVVATASNQEVCATTATLDGNDPATFGTATGTWTTVGGTSASITTPNQYNTGVTGLDPDANQFQWEITKGTCSDAVTITITNNSVTANAGPDQNTLCADNTVLAANTVAGASGQWSVVLGSGSFADNTLATTAVSVLSSDWNEFTWTLTKGSCTNADNVRIRNILPNTADAGPNQSVCGTTASLSGNAVTTPNSAGIWSVVSGGAISFVDNTNPSTNIDGLANGDNILNWRIYSTIDNTCFSDDQVTITNISLTGVTAGPDQNVCGTTATLNGSDPGSGSGLWTLISGSGSPTFPTLSNTPVTGLGQGPNTFEWTVTGGTCSGTDQVVIYNDFPSTANAGADGESCDGTYVLAANNPVIGTGAWSSTALGPVFANNTVFNTTVSNLNNGINTLTWTITNGACSDADDVVITNNTVTPPDAGADQQACTDTYTLAAQDPIEGSGQWSVVTGTAAFADATLFNTSVIVQRGDNQLRWTVTKGSCSAYDDVVISNYSVSANAGLDNYTCDGTFTLQGNNPASQYIAIPGINATGTWTTTGPANIANPNIYNTAVSNLNTDANTFTWTIDNGFCSASDDVVISNDMPTLPTISTNDTTFCGVDFLNADNGDSYSSIFNALHANTPDYLRGGVGETGVWTQIAGSGTFLDPSTSPDMRVDNLAQYAQLTGPDYWSLNPTVNTFRWTITYKNCTLYDEVTITNAAPNLADAGPDQRVCFDEANLNALDHGSRAQTHVWTESAPGGSGAVIDDPNAFNSYVYSLQSDTTTFRWTKTNVINGITCLVWDETQIIKTNNTGRPNAGPNQILCATEADMSASPADIGFPATDVVSGQWSILIGTGNFANIADPSTHVTNLAYQTNIFRWTVTNTTQNCIATDDVEITNALPSNANAGPDQYVCTNTALLSADRPTRGTGQWSVIGGGGTISNTTCQNFSCNVYVSNMGTGKNTFLWTMSNSYTDPASGETKTCTLTDEIQVWNNQVTAEAGLDQTVCVDDATLSATAPGIGETGQWTVTGGSGIVADISLYNSTVSNLSPNVNTFRWRLSNPYCSDEDYMTIINNNPTNPSVSVPSADICVNYTQINANNPTNGTGLWSVTTGGGTIANPSLASTTASGLIVGLNEFTWTITKNGCPESATVQVYNKSVTADAGTDIDNICGIEPAISSVNLAATSPNYTNGESGTWTVVTGVGTVNIADPTAFNTQVTGMDDGINTFRWTITNGTCSADDMVNVHVYIPTTAATNPDREVCASLTDIEVLTANPPDPGRGTGTWTLVSGGGAIADPTANVTNVTNLGYNENRFRWTIDNNGCTSTNDIILTNNYVIADAGPDQSICTDVATLAANDPTVNDVAGLAQASGQWTVVQGSGVFVNDTQYDTQVSGLSTAVTNILRWTVTKGSGACSVYDDVSIINNEFTVTAGTDQTVCSDNTTLNGQQPGANQTGLWSLQSGGGSFVYATLYNTQVTGLSINPNIFRWTVTNTTSDNCSANALVTVYYNKVEANAGTNDRICTDFTNLNGNLPNSGSSGNWVATFGGASITTPSSNTTAVTNLGTGQNTFEWTVSRTMNGQYCEAKDYVNIYNDTPTTALVESDKSICDDFSTLNVVTTPTIGTGTWSRLDNAATIDNISSLNANVIGLNLGINTFRWTVSNNACSSTDDLVITNNKVIANAGIDKSTGCTNSTTLSGNDPSLTQGSGLWIDLSGTLAVITTPTLYNTSVTNLEQGTTQFQWTVSLSGCTQSDIVNITNNQITASAGADQTTCNDFWPHLDGNDVSSNGTGVWTSIGNTANITNPTLFNTEVTSLDAGINTFRWTVVSNAEGCTDFDEVAINNNGVKATVGADFETCDPTITLSAVDPAPNTGYWSQTSGNAVTIVNSLQTNTQITGLTGGVYSFTWTVVNGACNDAATMVVTNNTPQPAIASTGTPESCNGSGSLTANVPDYAVGETGLWTKVNALGTFADPTSNNTTISGMKPGDNIFRWTLSKGNVVVCTTDATVTITNNEITTVSASSGTGSNISCDGTASLVGTDPAIEGATGIWTASTAAVFADNTAFTTTASNLADGANIFTWSLSKGTCPPVSADVTITNSQVIANAGADKPVCGSTTALEGTISPSGTGLWTIITAGPGTVIQNSSDPNSTVTGLQPGANVFKWTTTRSSCSDEDFVTITNDTVQIADGTTQTVCAFEADLVANPLDVGQTGLWTAAGSNPIILNSTSPTTHVTNLDYGNNAFFWTVTSAGGCSTTKQYNIINNSPTPANAGVDQPLCVDYATVTGNNPIYGTGKWSLSAGAGSIVDANSTSTLINNLGAGTNVFRWTISYNGCTDFDEVNLINNSFTVKAGIDQPLCADSTTLNADAITGGYWTLVSGSGVIQNSMSNTSAVTNLGQGANTFRWTAVQESCSASDDVIISNNSVTPPSVLGGGEYCTADGITITGDIPTGTQTGLWTLTGGSGTIAVATDNVTTVSGLSNLTPNKFTWTISDKGCSASAELTILNNSVTADAGGNQTLCADNTNLGAAVPAVGTGYWTVTSSTGIISNSLANNSVVTNLNLGNNIFTWTVERGICSASDNVLIINDSPTTANAGGDQTICSQTTTLNGNSPLVGTGKWSTLSSTAIIAQPTQFDTQVTVDIGSSTQFTWTITNGICSSDDIVTITNNSFNVYAGIDRTLCTDTHVMEADNPGTGTGAWTILSGSAVFSNSAQYNATVTSLGLGENIFRWTITRNGCSVYDDVKLTNSTVSASANNQFLCVDNTILDGNDPSLINSQGIWSVVAPAGANIITPTLFNSAVTNLTSGKNYLRWTVYNQDCSIEKTVEIEYYVPVVNAGGDVPFRCDNQIQLDGNQPPATGSGIWSSVSGSTILDPTLYNTQVTNLDIGDNVFRWTIFDKGCTNWDEVVINNSLPKNDNGTDQSGCTETFVMNAEQPTATGSGLWTVVSSSGTVVFADNTLYSTIVTVPSGNNILKWTITDNGCSNEKTFNITNNLPNAIASNGDTLKVCRDEVQLSGSQPGVGESGVWTIDGGVISEVFDNASIYNPIVSNLRKGQITFVWTVSNAYCTDQDRAVVVNNTPVVDAGSDRTICEDQINLAANIPGSGESGLWTINSTTVVIDNPTLYNTHVSNMGNTNTFRWTIDNGICTAFDEVIITSRNIDVSAGLAYQEACADTLFLEATDPSTVGSGTGTGFWTAIEGTGTFDNASSYTTIGRNLRNYNKLRWTIVDLGCTYYDEIAFVSLLPTKAATGLDKPVCASTTQITGSTPDYSQGETGWWDVTSGSASISDPTAFQTVVTNLNSGTNVFRWTISNASCSDEDYITITNNQVFADAGTDQPAVCDSSATISANLLTGTGYWTTTSPTATIQNSLATTTLVEHLSFGANNFQWIVSNNGCSDIDEVIVTSTLPRNVYAGPDQNICTDVTNLAASNPGIGTGLWQNTGGAGTVADPTANQTTVSGLANNENRFTWTVTVNGCSETDEMSIFNNSIYVNAGTDQTICNQDTLVLNGTIPGTGVTGTWSVRGGSGTFDNSSIYNTAVRNIAKGINTYRWTLSDGNCTNYAELTVTNNTPDSAIVGGNQFICTDNTIINAIPVTNGTGKWSVSSGAGSITNKTSYNTSVTGINKGPNTFTWTVTKNACQLSADLVVTNNSVDAYIADNEVIICTDTHTATIIGNAPGTGETGYWVKQNPADAGIIVNSNSNVTNVTNLANGDTYFTWTIENGLCSNSDVVKVTDNYYNTTATPAGPSTLCVDYSPILGGTPPAGGTGKWSSTAPDVTFDNDTKVSTIVRNLPGGTSAITWTVTKDGCSAPASFNLINNAIYTSAGADQIVCTDYTTMNAQALLSGETGQWTVNNSSVIITDTSDPTTAVSNLIPGANTFTWTIQGNGCTATDEIIVSANAFSVTAGNDDIACGTSYNLAASDPLTGTGTWTVASGTGRFANSSNFETTVYDMENGPNTFTWTVNRNGCVASDDVTITNNLYIAVVGDDKPVCSDQTTVSAQPLNPVWGATGMWTAQTGGGVFTDPTNESTLVTGLAVGNNRLRWTVTKTESGTTCTSYDEMIVTNNSVTASAGTNETTCDDFTTLSATPLDPGATGLWSGGGVTTTIVTPTSATTLVTGLQQGVNTFSWTVNDKGCVGTSSVQITSNYFVANAGGDQIVTVNTATMNALLPDVTATGTWSIVSGNGTFTNPNDPADVITGLGYGVNTFRWSVVWNSCPSYDDVNITYNSITADAGSNQTICASSTTMNAGDPFPGTGTWSVISGSATIADVNNPNTQVTDIQPGSLNILRWTVEISGYSEYDDVSILNGEFNISAGIDKEECTNETVMTAEDPGSGTGSWSVLAGGGNFDDNSLNISRVTNLDEGINLFVWSVTKPTGCSNSDTVQIIYNLPPSAAFEMDQSDGCSPIDVTFTNTTTGGSVYYWYFKNDFRVDSSLTSFTRTYEASYNADSTYSIQLVAESSKGCTDTVVHTVTVYRIPQVDFSATPTAQLYPRTEVFVENLSGSGYPNYYWDMGDGNTYLHNTLVENFSHSYATWGEYIITLTVSENNCTDTVQETVIIYPPQPESTIKPGVRAQGCEDLSVNFESYVNYADTFYWDFGDGGSSNEQNPTYIYDTPGTFIVTLYAGGPGTNDSLITVRRDTVVVFEVPIADFEVIPDTVMLPDQPVILHNNSINGDRYQWTFGGVGDAISTERSPIHYYTDPGIYTITLEVWTENDCYDTKTIENAVVVEPAGTYIFPTAFNPFSKEERNKVFKPKYRGIREYKLEIYNRWGEKVFESTDPEVGWDGYIDGKIGAQDVYAWKVTGKYKNGAPFQGTGDVTLLR